MATKRKNVMAENNHKDNEHTRGGTSAQHAKAGHLGGIAHHTCRGRQCSKESHLESGSESKGKKSAE